MPQPRDQQQQRRAWAVLTIKAQPEVAGQPRRFVGMATTPQVDRMGDIVDPAGAQYKLPIPLLWQHDSHLPCGEVVSAKVSKKGIEVTCEIPWIEEPGTLKDRLDEYWQSVKAGLVKGLSIGFNPDWKAAEEIEGTWGYVFKIWEWLELSLVTIPANADSGITAIKSADMRALAALGRKPSSQLLPGASGASKAASSGNINSNRGTTMKTLQELRARQDEIDARRKELMTLRTKETRGYTEEERGELDALEAESADIQDDIRDINFHQRSGAGGSEVRGTNSNEGSGSRAKTSTHVIVRKSDPADEFEGQSFVRIQIAKALARLNSASAVDVAVARWGKSHPQLVEVIRAGVAGASTDTWGAELVSVDNRFNGDFIEYLYGRTVFDRLPLRSVPADVAIKGQDGAATAFWVGESKAIPVTSADFSTVSLSPLKLGAIATVSKELLRRSDPSAERLVRDALVNAAAQLVDTTFFSTTAASAGVRPAGILNGVTPIATSGTDGAAVRNDIKKLVSPFITAKNNSGLGLVMGPATAEAIGSIVNALGQDEFPNLTAEGGTLRGRQVLTGDNIDNEWMIMGKWSDVWKIDDRGVEVSMSDVAMIEQDSAPTGAQDTPAAATANLVSMFQTDAVAFKIVRSVNWGKRRTGAVQYINNADYDGTVS
jgi:HK97 family phage major capsid protein/HK97 family phage prohead protease